MTITVGPYRFDHANYDELGDVLYLRLGEVQPAADAFGTPEGHAVRFDDQGTVIGITIVNARWLIDRDGKILITVPSMPSTIEASADDLAPAFGVIRRYSRG